MVTMTTEIKSPDWIEGTPRVWDAHYRVSGTPNVRQVSIESRSSIEVMVVKTADVYGEHYFISSPNFGVAIPDISSLQETFWITEKLVHAGMPGPDAATVAQVLRNLVNYELEDEQYCVLRYSEDLYERRNDYFDKPHFFDTLSEAEAYADEAVESMHNYPADGQAYIFRLVTGKA